MQPSLILGSQIRYKSCLLASLCTGSSWDLSVLCFSSPPFQVPWDGEQGEQSDFFLYLPGLPWPPIPPVCWRSLCGRHENVGDLVENVEELFGGNCGAPPGTVPRCRRQGSLYPLSSHQQTQLCPLAGRWGG